MIVFPKAIDQVRDLLQEANGQHPNKRVEIYLRALVIAELAKLTKEYEYGKQSKRKK